MKKGGVFAAVVLLMVAVVTAQVAQEPAAADCQPTELLPCLGAISLGQAPSAECCSGLKEQQPCFCEYLKNPQYKAYIDSPNARKTADACGVTIPTTC